MSHMSYNPSKELFVINAKMDMVIIHYKTNARFVLIQRNLKDVMNVALI